MVKYDSFLGSLSNSQNRSTGLLKHIIFLNCCIMDFCEKNWLLVHHTATCLFFKLMQNFYILQLIPGISIPKPAERLANFRIRPLSQNTRKKDDM